MADNKSGLDWVAKIPVALILAVLSAIVFFVQLDFERKNLAAEVVNIKLKQTAHVEEIVKLNEQVKGIDLRLARIERSQDKILDLLMERRKPEP